MGKVNAVRLIVFRNRRLLCRCARTVTPPILNSFRKMAAESPRGHRSGEKRPGSKTGNCTGKAGASVAFPPISSVHPSDFELFQNATFCRKIYLGRVSRALDGRKYAGKQEWQVQSTARASVALPSVHPSEIEHFSKSWPVEANRPEPRR